MDFFADLPHLTGKQFAFVQELLAGATITAAYRAVYRRDGSPRTCYRNARRIEGNWKIQHWLWAIRESYAARASI